MFRLFVTPVYAFSCCCCCCCCCCMTSLVGNQCDPMHISNCFPRPVKTCGNVPPKYRAQSSLLLVTKTNRSECIVVGSWSRSSRRGYDFQTWDCLVSRKLQTKAIYFNEHTKVYATKPHLPSRWHLKLMSSSWHYVAFVARCTLCCRTIKRGVLGVSFGVPGDFAASGAPGAAWWDVVAE